MKAELFIKTYGLDRAKKVIQNADEHAIQYVIDFDYYASGITTDNYVLLSELKRLVESHDVVEKLGGIESASKAALKENERGHIINEGLILSSIRDVRSCQ